MFKIVISEYVFLKIAVFGTNGRPWNSTSWYMQWSCSGNMDWFEEHLACSQSSSILPNEPLPYHCMCSSLSTSPPLTLKWPRYFYSRWCPRGSHETPWGNHFSTGILQWNLHHICTGNKKSQFCKKKKKKKWNKIKCCTVSKWRPNNRFFFQVISILAKFWKTTFPKEFVNEIWLKEGEYK